MRLFCLCAIGAALCVTYADAALLRSRRDQSVDEVCTFKIFTKQSLFRKPVEHATPKNIVFRTKGALVVQDHDSRVLVFVRRDQQGTACHEQAEIKCLQAEKGNLLQGASLRPFGHGLEGSGSAACSSAPPCHASDMPGLSYIRSMIGGSVAMVGTSAKRIASIGLGAGTIPLWFSRNMPGVEVDSVDLNPEVIQAAPCFGVVNSPMLRLIESDGRKYLANQPNGTFDVILLDAFDNKDYIPNCLKTSEFFSVIRAKLAPGGVLAVNSWKRETPTVYASMAAVFTAGSIQIGRSPGLGNDILLAQGPGSRVSRAGAATQASALEAKGADEVSAWNAAAAFHVPTQEAVHEGAINTDEKLCPSP